MLIFAQRLFDGAQLQEDRVVEIRNGRIHRVEAAAPDASADLACPLLAPGFIDLHIHGCRGFDTMGGAEHIRGMARALPEYGVTGFLPTTVAASIPDTRLALKGAAELMEASPGARVLGCHLEGPFLNPFRKGAQPEAFLLPPSLSAYEALTEGYRHAVRMMTIAPELPGAPELMEALKGEIVLSAGHTNATFEQLLGAVGRGLSQITHLFNAMSPLSHRAPGAAGAALSSEALCVQVIADLVHLHPAVLRLIRQCKPQGNCLLITDAIEATGMPDGTYRLGFNKVLVKGNEARLPDGTLAGSVLTMDRAVRNMISAGGADLAQALGMASRNPADALGIPDMGRIQPGARADLVFLDQDLTVRSTMVDGRILFTRS